MSRTRAATPVGACLLAACLVLAVIGPYLLISHASLFDLRVYQQGAFEAAHRTGRLYVFGVQGYPFTYPPAAGLMLSPLAFVPLGVLKVLWTVLLAPTLVFAWWLTLRAGARGHLRPWLPTGWPFAVVVAASALLLDPVERTFHFGQVGLVLLAVVLLDLVGPVSERHRGVLTGLAAALKLTPLVFVVFLALSRQWRALRNAVAAFVVAAGVGFVVLPDESWSYWTRLVFDSSRIGPVERASNQSVMGVLVRLGAAPGAPGTRLVWLLVAGALGCAAMALAVLCWQRGEELLAVGLTGLVALFASPISWTHHWVWCIPLGVGLASATRRWSGAVAGWVAAGSWWAVFVLAPQVHLPHGDQVELRWNPAQQVLGSTYVWAGALVLGYVARQLWAHRAEVAGGREPARTDAASGGTSR